MHGDDAAAVLGGFEPRHARADLQRDIGMLERHGQRRRLGIHLAVLSVRMRVPRGLSLGKPAVEIEA
ncbi:hypothetical protein D3C72_2517130 [compost metagenome]